jgi:hypothetical protein
MQAAACARAAGCWKHSSAVIISIHPAMRRIETGVADRSQQRGRFRPFALFRDLILSSRSSLYFWPPWPRKLELYCRVYVLLLYTPPSSTSKPLDFISSSPDRSILDIKTSTSDLHLSKTHAYDIHIHKSCSCLSTSRSLTSSLENDLSTHDTTYNYELISKVSSP